MNDEEVVALLLGRKPFDWIQACDFPESEIFRFCWCMMICYGLRFWLIALFYTKCAQNPSWQTWNMQWTWISVFSLEFVPIQWHEEHITSTNALKTSLFQNKRTNHVSIQVFAFATLTKYKVFCFILNTVPTFTWIHIQKSFNNFQGVWNSWTHEDMTLLFFFLIN